MLAFFFTITEVGTSKIRLLGLFGPESGLFRQKEDQFTSTFSKWTDIRPRSDKADLLGSTETPPDRPTNRPTTTLLELLRAAKNYTNRN